MITYRQFFLFSVTALNHGFSLQPLNSAFILNSSDVAYRISLKMAPRIAKKFYPDTRIIDVIKSPR